MKSKRTFVLASAILLMFSLFPAMPLSVFAETPVTAFYVGSPLCMINGEVAPLCSEHPQSSVVLSGQSAFLPAEALSEHFGCEVSYDEKDQAAKIIYSGTSFVFPIGKAHFITKNKTYPLAASTYLDASGNVMIPLRAAAETVLDTNISYANGAILIGGYERNLMENTAEWNEIKQRIGLAVVPSSYSDVLNLIKSYGFFTNAPTHPSVTTFEKLSSVASPVMSKHLPYQSDQGVLLFGSAPVYDGSDIFPEGGNYGSIFKKQGDYLYACNSNLVTIYKDEGTKLTLLSQFFAADGKEAAEMYVTGNQLILAGTKRIFGNRQDVKCSAFIDIIDISKKEAPILSKSLEVGGLFTASRISDGYLNFVCIKSLYNLDSSSPETVLPFVTDGSGREKPVPLENILLMPDVAAPDFISVASIDLSGQQPDKIQTVLASNYSIFSLGGSALYLADMSSYGRTETAGGRRATSLARLSVGRFAGLSGCTMLPGWLEKPSAMNENNDYLRIITEDYWASNSGNALYILDKQLNVVGSVTSLGPGKTIEAVRLLKERAVLYFKRPEDPVIVLDLFDPRNPSVAADTVVPEIHPQAQYPFTDTLLAGITQDVTAVFYGRENGYTGGLRFSLSDIGTADAPKELGTLVFGGEGSSCGRPDNCKAILLDPQNMLIGLAVNLTPEKTQPNAFSGLLLLKITEQGLTECGRIPMEGAVSELSSNIRLLADGSKLYCLYMNSVSVYRLDDLEKITQSVPN